MSATAATEAASDIVNAHFRKFYPLDLPPIGRPPWKFSNILGGIWRYEDYGVETIFPRIVCADGFSFSAQGHRGAYSCPRGDFADRYSAVEVGFPSAADDLIQDLAESPEAPTETVYGWVPVETVVALIEKHGGIFDWNAADIGSVGP